MTDHEVTMLSGGIAQWGRALPLRGEMTTVTFEADLMTKLVLSGSAEPTFFRSVFIGMDEVDVDGSTPRGHGVVRLEDPRTGDLLLGHVDWYMVDGKDKGQFTFDDGTGPWKGVAGEVAVDLEFCSHTPEIPLNSGVPVKGLAFIEGAGRFTLRD
jgi:hypothetical protein